MAVTKTVDSIASFQYVNFIASFHCVNFIRQFHCVNSITVRHFEIASFSHNESSMADAKPLTIYFSPLPLFLVPNALYGVPNKQGTTTLGTMFPSTTTTQTRNIINWQKTTTRTRQYQRMKKVGRPTFCHCCGSALRPVPGRCNQYACPQGHGVQGSVGFIATTKAGATSQQCQRGLFGYRRNGQQ